MDKSALYKMSNGLYLISSKTTAARGGCIINTLEQVTSSPEQLIAAVNKNNYTSELIIASGMFSATVITENIDMNIIADFGFRSGRDVDKFADYEVLTDKNGMPYIKGGMAARYSLTVRETVDVGTHLIFIGALDDAEVLDSTPVMTYAHYHQVKNGTTPKNASSYQEKPEESGYRCSVCGYIARTESLPDDYICPVCKHPREVFVKL